MCEKCLYLDRFESSLQVDIRPAFKTYFEQQFVMPLVLPTRRKDDRYDFADELNITARISTKRIINAPPKKEWYEEPGSNGFYSGPVTDHTPKNKFVFYNPPEYRPSWL